MSSSARSTAFGLSLAVFATFSWALNFATPHFTGAYTAYDLIALRALITGLIGLLLLGLCRARLQALDTGHRLLGAFLGIIGYLGYFACIMGGVIFAGPVVTPAILALVPPLLAVLGNRMHRTLSWGRLAGPIMLIVAGILLINVRDPGQPASSSRSLAIGIACSLLAVSLWLLFSVINQRVLERHANLHLTTWTALMMAGSGFGIILFVPFGLSEGWFNFPALGFGLANAGELYLWALLLALLSSVGGAWAWNVASSRLPLVLSGQLVSLETLFAALFGFIAQRRLPTLYEGSGLAMLLAGTTLAVGVVLSPRLSAQGATQ